MIASDLLPFLPEVILITATLMLLLMGTVGRWERGTFIGTLALLVTFCTAGGIAFYAILVPEEQNLFSGSLFTNPLTAGLKVLLLVSAGLVMLMGQNWLHKEKMDRPEFFILMLFSLIGMMVMLSARDLLVLYVGVELQSLSLYILATFQRDKRRSCEAGLKYFILGALASGILLYGMSLVYGAVGSTRYDDILAAAGGIAVHPWLMIGFAFVLCALCFKLAAAPFNMWAPDVYEGAPTLVTSFFSIAPKIAGIGLMMILLYQPFSPFAEGWRLLLSVIAALTMTVGALGGIGQTNLKRLLAYSSISHVGFILVGVCLGTGQGAEAALLYLVFYVVMSLGVFALLLSMRKQGRAVEEVADLAGAATLYPGMAAAMAILMFSMAGIPPLVGFFNKLYIFMAAIDAGMVWLAVWGSLASVVAAYYYFRIVKVMYVDKPIAPFDQPIPPVLSVTLVVTSVLSLAGLALMGTILGFLTIILGSVAFPG